MSEWEKISITLPERSADMVAEFIISATSRGVEIQDAHGDEVCVTAWLSTQEVECGMAGRIEDFIRQIQKAAGADAGVVTLLREDAGDQDWAEKWKEFFRPVRIGRHFVVKPQWESFEPEAKDIIIEIDPGQAFGVGTHASTALMLENMEWLWEQRRKDVEFLPWVLDTGTGTGILGIAAAKMGAARVTAIDIDPEAVRTARENAGLNDVGHVMRVNSTTVGEITEKFDVVLANIDRDTLRVLAADLAGVMAVRGILMVSGILREQRTEVEQLFSEQGLGVTRASAGSGAGDRGNDEWVCLVFE